MSRQPHRSPASPTPPGLGPHCVGQRVVVRRVLPGQTGPTGGPAFTDLLGVMETWTATATGIRAADGTLTEIALADIVSGKPVPPRPSVRARVSPEEAERRAAPTWPAVESSRLGDWMLRASAGYTGRANSALVVGEPDRDWDAALAEVVDFYAARGLPAQAQVVVGSAAEQQLLERGWCAARPEEDSVAFLIGGVAAAMRAARRAGGAVSAVEVGAELPEGWIAADERARQAPEAARAVLTGPTEVAFAQLREDGRVVARGRAALDGAPDPWAGVTALWVDPDHRRRGLATSVMGSLLDWAAERGATTAYLQVPSDNEPALALYARLGFTEHHAYRYLLAP